MFASFALFAASGNFQRHFRIGPIDSLPGTLFHDSSGDLPCSSESDALIVAGSLQGVQRLLRCRKATECGGTFRSPGKALPCTAPYASERAQLSALDHARLVRTWTRKSH